MKVEQYLKLIKGLPRPTPEQYAEFAKHIFTAHSWYKHIPFESEKFTFCLAPDAGTGRTYAKVNADDSISLYPAETMDFTVDHPRRHHSWQTTAEYRERFGYLVYFYGSSRDEGYIEFELPEELQSRVRIDLVPSVAKDSSSDDERMDSISLYLKDSHVLHLFEKHFQHIIIPAQALKEAEEELSSDDKSLLKLLDEGSLAEEDLASNSKISHYLKWKRDYLYSFEIKYDIEMKKVREAFDNLDAWLVENTENG